MRQKHMLRIQVVNQHWVRKRETTLCIKNRETFRKGYRGAGVAEVEGRSVRRGKDGMAVNLRSEPTVTPRLDPLSPQTDASMDPHLTPKQRNGNCTPVMLLNCQQQCQSQHHCYHGQWLLPEAFKCSLSFFHFSRPCLCLSLRGHTRSTADAEALGSVDAVLQPPVWKEGQAWSWQNRYYWAEKINMFWPKQD